MAALLAELRDEIPRVRRQTRAIVEIERAAARRDQAVRETADLERRAEIARRDLSTLAAAATAARESAEISRAQRSEYDRQAQESLRVIGGDVVALSRAIVQPQAARTAEHSAPSRIHALELA